MRNNIAMTLMAVALVVVAMAGVQMDSRVDAIEARLEALTPVEEAPAAEPVTETPAVDPAAVEAPVAPVEPAAPVPASEPMPEVAS